VLHGATPSPFDALNALRGIRTLAVRTAHQSDAALFLAEALADHPAVAEVRYPGLASHPQHHLARRQMRHGGTLLALELTGGRAAAQRLLGSLRIARVATSLGGPETLVCHPATTTHASLTPAEAAAAGVTDGLLRVSVGLEDPVDILADLTAALG
jgi:cystathionine beta-lyase/cystathionine gamma-synthase